MKTMMPPCNVMRTIAALIVKWNWENMERQDKELTAYCGLFCGDCIRYKSRSSDLALQLLNELKKLKFEDYAKVKQRYVKELESYKAMVSTLEVICKLKCDIPCRSGSGGCTQPCEIAKCVNLKGIEGCWECKELEACDKFEFLKPFHGNAPRDNTKRSKNMAWINGLSTERAYTHGLIALLRTNDIELTACWKLF